MQNRRVWIAGSKLGKFRGLIAKNRAKLEILWNYMDCGLISKKPRDSFAKMLGLKRCLLIWAVGFGSGGPESDRARAEAGPRWSWSSRGGALPE